MIRNHLRARRVAAFLLATCAALAAPWAAAQQGEPAMVKRATELRDAPGEAGKGVAQLPAQAPVTRLAERKGPWVQVRTAAGQTGWVHLFDVAPASGAGAMQGSSGGAASDAVRGVASFLTPRSTTSSGGAPSTIGVRGLTAEDLANAQPNPDAVKKMEDMRQSEAQARQFAGSASLQAVAVDPLPAPPPPAGSSAGGGNPSSPNAP